VRRASTKTTGWVVTYPRATAVDKSGANASQLVTCSPASGSRFFAGSTRVTCNVPTGDSCRYTHCAARLPVCRPPPPPPARSFRVTLPLAEYHFYNETAATASGTLLATDRAGNMNLFGYNGASVAYDTGLAVNVLRLTNPVSYPSQPSTMQTARSAAGSGPVTIRDKAFVAYFAQNANNGPDAGVFGIHSDAGDNEVGGLIANVGAAATINS
jgi:hypothetical protein